MCAMKLQPKKPKQEPVDSVERVLDKSYSELLVFGCVRKWYFPHVPQALCYLMLHFHGAEFLWTIYEKDLVKMANYKYAFKSKPFIINNITFQSIFNPCEKIEYKDKDGQLKDENVVRLYTKILSMSNTIRTCTAYYEYSILSKTFKSRHTFNMTASRASLPKRFMKGLRSPIKYPLHLLITVEPIRIHHWSMDKMVDYQQDILMKEYVKYEWQIEAWTIYKNKRYLQSESFGICWCLDLDLCQHNLCLKLMRLAPNINRIRVECLLKGRHKDEAILLSIDEEFEFTFINEGTSMKLNETAEESKALSALLEGAADVILDVEVRIIEVYAINDVDDFETNDKMIPINKWTQYGIHPNDAQIGDDDKIIKNEETIINEKVNKVKITIQNDETITFLNIGNDATIGFLKNQNAKLANCIFYDEDGYEIPNPKTKIQAIAQFDGDTFILNARLRTKEKNDKAPLKEENEKAITKEENDQFIEKEESAHSTVTFGTEIKEVQTPSNKGGCCIIV